MDLGWLTIYLIDLYVLCLTLVSLTIHNSNFDKRVITYSIAYIISLSLPYVECLKNNTWLYDNIESVIRM